MKKISCVLLCLFMLIVFASCGRSEPPKASSEPTVETLPLLPSDAPTFLLPSDAVTEAPTDASTDFPTEAPTSALTDSPTDVPTSAPTLGPTSVPTDAPTDAMTEAPTEAPTNVPTEAPTEAPTERPTEAPTFAPTFEGTSAPTEAPTEAPTQAPTEAPTSAPTDAYDLYDALFNIENKVELFLDIEEEELWKIQADYEKYTVKMDTKSPIYRKADLIVRINGEEFRVEEVGFRMKGDISRRDFYGEDGYINAVHFKLSFDETFDDIDYYGDEAKVWTDTLLRDERKGRTFATLEELDLKWYMNHDSTHVREYYAYRMMRDYGVLAPLSGVASVDFNETHMGIFMMVEPIDEIFIERNLPEEDWGGDLYKTDTVNGKRSTYEIDCTYGVEDKDTGVFYNYNLKTNKKKSKHSSLKNLLEVLNQDDLTQEEFESVVDRDYFINFAAATFAIGNPDEMRFMAKNHYVYFLKSTGKAVFIIYDCDRVFGILCGWNPSENGMTAVDPFGTVFAWSKKSQPNKIFNKTVCVENGDYSGWYLREYAEKLKEIYNSKWFNHNTFMAIYSKAMSNYSKLAVPSVDFLNMTEERQKFNLLDVGTNDSIDTLLATPGTKAEYNIPMSTFMARVKSNMIPRIDEVLTVLDALE